MTKAETDEFQKSAFLKRDQLEREIRESGATKTQQDNMMHTLSKLCMFYADSVDTQKGRANRAEKAADAWKARCISALGELAEAADDRAGGE